MVKCPTGPSNSRLYGGNVKSNALGLPGGGLIAVGFDSYITRHAVAVVFYLVSSEHNQQCSMCVCFHSQCAKYGIKTRRDLVHAKNNLAACDVCK